MATINYSKLSDKKLNALMETATDEQKVLIQQELSARQAARAQATQEYVNEEPLSPEQEKQLAEAEANGGEVKKSAKLTAEELEALATECKKNIGHKCQVLPFNTAEWKDGVIIAVIPERRSSKVMYTIKLDDGKKVSKIHGSELLKISDEVVEEIATKRTKSKMESWSDEDVAKAIAEVAGNVGKLVSFKNSNGMEETGRITTVVADKRASAVLYKISQTVVTEEGEATTKYCHKVTTSNLTIHPEFDEVGQAMQDKFAARREKKAAQDNSPEARVLKCEESVKLAQERLAKAQEALKKAEDALAAAKVEASNAAAKVEAASAEDLN